MTNALKTAARDMLARAALLLQQHPRKLTASVAALLLGAGGGAFAVGDIDAQIEALPPLRQVVQEVQAPTLAAQADALEAFSFNLYRSDVTRSSDTVDSLLARLGINDPVAAIYLRSDAAFRSRVLGRGGQSVTAEATDGQSLVKLVARWAVDDSTFQRLVIERNAAGALATRLESAPLVATARLGSGTIYSSLFAAVDDARIPDAVAMQMADIFSGAVDFHRGLRRGDRFNVVYEALEADGEPLRTGRVLSAEFTNGGKQLNALWFQEPGKKGAYFDFAGKSLERTFLATPMEISRITSGFAMRFHPILGQWKAHNGVDFGAPAGAPVRTVGDGVVSFAGVQNGYGNVVVVDHGRGEVTLYGHLSRVDVRRGETVGRGQRIGAVGATGWATGPHLHFEFRENGVFKNPVEAIRQSPAVELTAHARPRFEQAVASVRMQLNAAGSMGQVAAR